MALPAADVASLHWRGLAAEQRDAHDGSRYLRHQQHLVPLLDLRPLAGAERRCAPEFVLVVRSASPAPAPERAGLLVEEFGEVLHTPTASAPLPIASPWWMAYLHAERHTLLATAHGQVPLLDCARLVASAPKWCAPGNSG